MSEPQAHVIEQARAAQEAASAAPASATDKFGHAFDANVHAVNADGTPKLTPTGRFAKLSKAATRATSALKVPERAGSAGAPSPAVSAAAAKEAAARASGAGAANLFLVFSIMLGGDEFHPRRDDKIGLDEKAMLEGAFGDYFVATGQKDLPPGWALVAAIGMYVAPRLTMPKTQSRISKAKSWIVAKWVNWKARKQGVRVKPDTGDAEK